MFVGRESEIQLLQRDNWRDSAELIVIYGRRRVGKTALVENSYKKRKIWKFEGLEGRSTGRQIKNFIFTLYRYTGDDSVKKKQNMVKTWQEALVLLNDAIAHQKLIIFFDEFQWMAAMRNPLVSTFKWAWDNHLKKHANCKFIICGSVSSFIVKNVLKSKSLYGRVDTEIHLKPFTLKETSAFFQGKRSNQETLEMSMVVGGIPQYLKAFEPGKSIAQNLHSLAFTPNGYFAKEYDRLFISHFAKNEKYEKIIKTIGVHGAQTRDALIHLLAASNGGTFSRLIDDLVLAEFLEKSFSLDKKPGGRLFFLRLHDEFLHFYFHFIVPYAQGIETGTINAYEILTGPKYLQWQGYAFERFCRKHAKNIAKALEFSGISYRYGSLFRKNEAQVDLLFKRADNVLTVCEIKHTDRLQVAELIRNFDKKIISLNSIYNLPIQKVLLLGKRIDVPKDVSGYFDNTLFAEALF